MSAIDAVSNGHAVAVVAIVQQAQLFRCAIGRRDVGDDVGSRSAALFRQASSNRWDRWRHSAFRRGSVPVSGWSVPELTGINACRLLPALTNRCGATADVVIIVTASRHRPAVGLRTT